MNKKLLGLYTILLALFFFVAGGFSFLAVSQYMSVDQTALYNKGEIAFFGLGDNGSLRAIVGEAIEATTTDKKVCTDDYSPVCGEDNVTYWNDCFAGRAGVAIAYNDSCNEKSKPVELSDSPLIIEEPIADTQDVGGDNSIPEEAVEDVAPEPQGTSQAEPEPPQDILEVAEDTSPKPDLSPTTFSHYGSLLVAGDIMSFSVMVVNNGAEMSGGIFNTQLFIDKNNDGSTEIAFKKIETPSLDVGEKETKIWKSAWSQKVGTHRAEVCVDVDNVIKESNEENNCVSMVFTIKGDEEGGDLVVTSIQAAPSSPNVGENISFYGVIKNIGAYRVATSYAYLTVDRHLIGRIKIPSLRSGLVEQVSWKTIWKATPGNHTYELCADGGGDILEENEDNNCVKDVFFVAE